MNRKEIAKKLQQMTAKSLVAAGETAGPGGDDMQVSDDEGGADGGGGDDDDGGGPLEKQLTSTLAWKGPATCDKNLKRMQKRGRQLKKVDAKRKREADEKGKAVRCARQRGSTRARARRSKPACWPSPTGELPC